jgi:hypothetical protein
MLCLKLRQPVAIGVYLVVLIPTPTDHHQIRVADLGLVLRDVPGSESHLRAPRPQHRRVALIRWRQGRPGAACDKRDVGSPSEIRV